MPAKGPRSNMATPGWRRAAAAYLREVRALELARVPTTPNYTELDPFAHMLCPESI